MQLKEKIEELKNYLSEYEKLVQAMSLVYWDMRTAG